MVSNKVETKKQIIYTNTHAVNTPTASTISTPLLSFKNTQNNNGLSIEHTTNLNQQSVQSYVSVQTKDGKSYNFNATLEKRINNVTTKLQNAEKENGPIGKAWSWIKDTIGFGDSSNKVREIQANERKLLAQFNANEKTRANVFKQLTGCEYNEENLEKFIKGQIKLKSEIAIEKYKEGQDMAVDIASDIISGVVAYGTAAACIAGGIAAAPFTAGASLGAVAVGVGIAAGAGAATKVAIKGGEALVGGKEYSLKQAGKDATIGLVSGALAPVTIGAGGAVATSVGKVAPKFVATTARLSVEGATFGAADGATRSALEGDSIGDVALNGLKGAGVGALAGNVLGHSGNALGKGAKIVYEKITPVHHGNGFSYRVNPFGKKYNLELDAPNLEEIKFDLQISRKANPHPTNLTNELKRNHYDNVGVETLLKENPSLSPVVGSLPQKWGKAIGSKGGFAQIDEIFYNFSKKYHNASLTDSDLAAAERELSKLLRTTVKIKTLDSGLVGMCFVIEAQGQKFVLKAYHKFCTKPLKDHGNFAELSSAVYASQNDRGHFAKFYMGRFGKNNDGYILTKFIEENYDPLRYNFNLRKSITSMSSDDLGHNVHGKTIIDYGCAWSDNILTRFNFQERKILRQLVGAIDNNNVEEIEKIVARHSSSKDFINPVKYIKALIHNTQSKPLGGFENKYYFAADYYTERAQCLQKLNIEIIPSLNNANVGIVSRNVENYGHLMRRSSPDNYYLEKYHGLDFDYAEWHKLFYGNK